MNNVALDRARSGAYLLDCKGPKDWRKKVNLEILALSSDKHCVLGQIYGNYDLGMDALGISSLAPIDLGFCAGSGSAKHEYVSSRELDEAWRELLSTPDRIGKIYKTTFNRYVKVIGKSENNGVLWVCLGSDVGGRFEAHPSTPDYFVRTEERIEKEWTEVKPLTAVKGDVLFDNEGNLYLVGSDEVWRLHAGEGKNQFRPLESWIADGVNLQHSTSASGERMSAKF